MKDFVELNRDYEKMLEYQQEKREYEEWIREKEQEMRDEAAGQLPGYKPYKPPGDDAHEKNT